MLGLGKPRSKFARYIDKHDISQQELVMKAKLIRLQLVGYARKMPFSHQRRMQGSLLKY